MIPGALSIWRRRVVARMTETFPGRSARRETRGYRWLGGADDCRQIAERLSNGLISDHLGNNSRSRLTSLKERNFNAAADDRLQFDVRPRGPARRSGPGRRGPLPQ